MDAKVVSDDGWEACEVAVELDDGFDFGFERFEGVVGDVLVGVLDRIIGFLLNAVAAPVDLLRAHEQEQGQTDEWQQQNCEQPGC